MMSSRKTLNTLKILLSFCILQVMTAQANATQLTGKLINFYTDFAETIPSFEADYGSGPVQTGDISLVLDPGLESKLIIDFDNEEVTEILNFRASSAYISSLGVPYLTMKSVATGDFLSAIPDLPDDGMYHPFVVEARVSGLTNVDPGQPLSFVTKWMGEYDYTGTALVAQSSPAGLNFVPKLDAGVVNRYRFDEFTIAGSVQTLNNVTSTGTGALYAPGPLPILGAAAGFRFSRKLRHRIKATKAV